MGGGEGVALRAAIGPDRVSPLSRPSVRDPLQPEDSRSFEQGFDVYAIRFVAADIRLGVLRGQAPEPEIRV